MKRIAFITVVLLISVPCFAGFGRETLYETRQETEFDAGDYSGIERVGVNVQLEGSAGTTTIDDFEDPWDTWTTVSGGERQTSHHYSGSYSYSPGSWPPDYKVFASALTPDTISLWFWKTTEGTGDFADAYLPLGNDVGFSEGWKCAFYIRDKGANKGKVSWYDSAGHHYGSYNYDSWNHLELRNIAWANPTGTCDYYLNGILIGEGLEILDNFGRIGMQSYSSPSYYFIDYITATSSYTSEGTYTTDVMDLGSIPSTDKIFLTKQTTPGTSTIDWKYTGCNDLTSGTWSDSAVTRSGGSVGRYRYRKFYGHLVLGDTCDTPYFWFLEVDPVGAINIDPGDEAWEEVEFGR